MVNLNGMSFKGFLRLLFLNIAVTRTMDLFELESFVFVSLQFVTQGFMSPEPWLLDSYLLLEKWGERPACFEKVFLPHITIDKQMFD